MSAAIGECRIEVPFAPIGLVFNHDGRVLIICSHPTSHGIEPYPNILKNGRNEKIPR